MFSIVKSAMWFTWPRPRDCSAQLELVTVWSIRQLTEAIDIVWLLPRTNHGETVHSLPLSRERFALSWEVGHAQRP
jgi:hypothetical protein